MDRLKLQTKNMADENFELLSKLFPNALTETIIGYDEEGKAIIDRAIDADVLRQEIACAVVEGRDERYQFTWPDKRKAILNANAPISETLRPCREESVDFDNTENLYIEGDNLNVLKILQETYLGKVKMIYIDPPYNTGKDFIYKDNFTENFGEYIFNSGQLDMEGNRMYANFDGNGRFHTDWLNMMYIRIKLARNLLTEDGILLISIDDNEVSNMTKVCDEIFGAENKTIPFIWLLPRGINAGIVARAHEYILCYARDIHKCGYFNALKENKNISIERCNKKIDSRHPESTITFQPGIRYEGPDKDLSGILEGSERITIIGTMKFRNGRLVDPVTLSAGWTMKNMILDWMSGKSVTDLKGQPIEEFFFKENGRLYSKKKVSTISVKSVLKDIPDTQKARLQMEELFGSQDVFSYPKPIELPKILTKLITQDGDLVLDFFSGSATTAHAVMKLNSEDGGRRKFIMVQLPEEINSASEAYQAGYHNICEIGKERIRRAGKKILEENPDAKDLDIGFRVLKLDSTNMKDVYYTPSETQQTLFDLYADNIKEDRTPEDLLFQVMLDLGVLLSSKIEETEIAGKKVFNVADGFLFACFDSIITDEVVKAVAQKKPYYAVFRDSCMANDSVAANFEQIFATYSPETVRKVL